MRSVQLVARRIKPQCVIYDFMRSVHLDARIINLNAQFMISYVACILMHDQTTKINFFNLFVYPLFRANSRTQRFCAGIGTEHVAQPQGEARIFVIEKAGSI